MPRLCPTSCKCHSKSAEGLALISASSTNEGAANLVGLSQGFVTTIMPSSFPVSRDTLCRKASKEAWTEQWAQEYELHKDEYRPCPDGHITVAKCCHSTSGIEQDDFFKVQDLSSCDCETTQTSNGIACRNPRLRFDFARLDRVNELRSKEIDRESKRCRIEWFFTRSKAQQANTVDLIVFKRVILKAKVIEIGTKTVSAAVRSPE